MIKNKTLFSKFLCTFFGLILFACSRIQAADQIDQIIAVVNEHIITQSELNRTFEETKAQLTSSSQPIPSEKELKKQILEKLIDKRLQLEIAENNKINITDQEVQHTINSIAEQHHITIDQIKQQVTAQGQSWAHFIQNIREQLVLQKIQGAIVGGQIKGTKAEFAKFKKEYLAKMQGSELEYHLIDFLVENPSSADQKETEKTANDVITLLQKGIPIEDIRPTYRDLGWRSKELLPDLFANQIVTLQEKGYAGPIKADNGLHVLKLIASRPTATSQTELTEQQLQQLYSQAKAKEKIQNWVNGLRKTSYIKIMKQ